MAEGLCGIWVGFVEGYLRPEALAGRSCVACGMRLRVDICAVGQVDGEFFLRSGFIWWERGGLRRSFEEGAGGVEIRPSALGLSPFLGASFEGCIWGAELCNKRRLHRFLCLAA